MSYHDLTSDDISGLDGVLNLFSEKILHLLDVDMIVKGNLEEIYSVDLEGYPFAACEDMNARVVCLDMNYRKEDFDRQYKDITDIIMEKAKVIHYIGATKPWKSRDKEMYFVHEMYKHYWLDYEEELKNCLSEKKKN